MPNLPSLGNLEIRLGIDFKNLILSPKRKNYTMHTN